MDLNVLAVVKRDEAGVVKADRSAALKVPAGCNAAELMNLIRIHNGGLALLGYANRHFDVFTDASLSEGSLLSGLTPVPAVAAGAAAAAGGAGGSSSSNTYTVVYLSLLGPREWFHGASVVRSAHDPLSPPPHTLPSRSRHSLACLRTAHRAHS